MRGKRFIKNASKVVLVVLFYVVAFITSLPLGLIVGALMILGLTGIVGLKVKNLLAFSTEAAEGKLLLTSKSSRSPLVFALVAGVLVAIPTLYFGAIGLIGVLLYTAYEWLVVVAVPLGAVGLVLLGNLLFAGPGRLWICPWQIPLLQRGVLELGGLGYMPAWRRVWQNGEWRIKYRVAVARMVAKSSAKLLPFKVKIKGLMIEIVFSKKIIDPDLYMDKRNKQLIKEGIEAA